MKSIGFYKVQLKDLKGFYYAVAILSFLNFGVGIGRAIAADGFAGMAERNVKDAISRICKHRGLVMPSSKVCGDKVKGLENSMTADKPSPVGSANPINASPGEDGPTSQIKKAAGSNQAAFERERERLAALQADSDAMKKETEERLRAAEDRARQIAAQQAADQAAADRVEADRQRRLIEQAKAAARKNREIPNEVISQTKDPSIRDELISAALAQDLRLDVEKKKTEAGLNLAQLAQMAGITLQAATAMTSLNQNPSGISAPLSSPTSAPPGAAQLTGRSLASNEKGKSQITSKSDEEAEAQGEQRDPNQLDDETIQKIKIAVADAEKRKEIYSKKHGLRDKLREQMAAKAKRGLASTEGVDTDSLFGGNLNAYQEEAAQAETASSTAKEDESFGYNAFQAMKTGFGLAGEETDREVDRIVAEAEDALGSPDAKAGILGTESMSLFQRVKLAHDNCVREKCVLLSATK